MSELGLTRIAKAILAVGCFAIVAWLAVNDPVGNTDYFQFFLCCIGIGAIIS